MSSVRLPLRNVPTRHDEASRAAGEKSEKQTLVTEKLCSLSPGVLRQVERYLTPIFLNSFLQACLSFLEAALFSPEEHQHWLALCHQDCCITAMCERAVRIDAATRPEKQKHINLTHLFHCLSFLS